MTFLYCSMVGFLVSNDNLPAHGAAEGGSGEAMNPVVFSNNIRVQQSGERLWLLRPEDGSATCALEKACFHFLTAERAFHNEPPKFHPGPLTPACSRQAAPAGTPLAAAPRYAGKGHIGLAMLPVVVTVSPYPDDGIPPLEAFFNICARPSREPGGSCRPPGSPCTRRPRCRPRATRSRSHRSWSWAGP